MPQYLSFPFMFLCFYYIWNHELYTGSFPPSYYFIYMITYSMHHSAGCCCFFFQVGIALFHFHQCIVFHCVSILLFNSHLEKHVTNNTVINILGCFPLGNMLKFLKDIHPEAIVQSSYKALTLLDTPR